MEVLLGMEVEAVTFSSVQLCGIGEPADLLGDLPGRLRKTLTNVEGTNTGNG